MRAQTLLTSRLRLEPLVAAHAEEMYPGLGDERLYRYLPEDAPADLEALRRRYQRLERRRSPDGSEGWLNWVVRLGDGGPCLGYVQATVDPAGGALIAYLIFPAHWGQGYAGEAVAAMLAELASGHGVTRCQALIDSRNLPSQRLVERLGFTRTAELRDADHFKGQRSHEYRYERPLPRR